MGSGEERIVDLYDRHAHRWDQERGRNLTEWGWLARLQALVPPGGSILDIGCGSGEPIAGHLLVAGHEVVGVDSSPAMIGICKRKFPEATWLVEDMRTLALGRRFAGILAWDSFFHLCEDDQRRMFPVFAAHAAPGAALMFTSGPSAGRAIGTYQGEPLFHASLGAEEYRALLDQHGFRVVAHIANDPECGGHTVWLTQRAL